MSGEDVHTLHVSSPEPHMYPDTHSLPSPDYPSSPPHYTQSAPSPFPQRCTYCAVFSIIGIVNVSKYPIYPPVLGLGIALICSTFAIPNVRPLLISVHRTAACECVCIHAPAPRFVNAAMKSGVQAEGFRSSGRRRYVCEVKSITNMLEGWRRSF